MESTEKEEKAGKKEDINVQRSDQEKTTDAQNTTKVNPSGWGDQKIKKKIEPTQLGWFLKQ